MNSATYQLTLTDVERSHGTHLEAQAFSSNELLSDGDQQIIRELIMEAEEDVRWNILENGDFTSKVCAAWSFWKDLCTLCGNGWPHGTWSVLS